MSCMLGTQKSLHYFYRNNMEFMIKLTSPPTPHNEEACIQLKFGLTADYNL